MSHPTPAECPDFWTIIVKVTATGWWLLSLLFYGLWSCRHRAKWDIHEEVEAGAGLYGVDGRDCWGHIGGVRVEEVGTAYCRGHYSRT